MAVFKNNRGNWTCKFYYTDWKGERKQKKKEGFQTKKEAQAFEADFLNSCKTDITITFSNLINVYMEDCRARLKPTTCANKEHLIRTKLIPYFGDLPLSLIDTATVRRWQNEIITSQEDYAPTYQKVIHNQLSAILNYAVKYYGLSSNAAARCGSIGKKHASKRMMNNGGENIIFVNSNTAYRAIPDRIAYSASKGGQLGMMRAMALDFGKYNIRVNAVLPGMIKTDRWEKNPEFYNNVPSRFTPIGDVAVGEDVADAVWYFAAHARNTTGAELVVDGGNTIQLYPVIPQKN